MTTPALAEPHVTGIKTLLTGMPNSLRVHIGEAPDAATRPYLVLWPNPGEPEGSLGDRHRDLLLTFTLTAVGETPQSALIYAGTARTALLTQVPAVTGRVVQPLWMLDPGPGLQRDDDVVPRLWYVAVVYRMRSEPA